MSRGFISVGDESLFCVTGCVMKYRFYVGKTVFEVNSFLPLPLKREDENFLPGAARQEGEVPEKGKELGVFAFGGRDVDLLFCCRVWIREGTVQEEESTPDFEDGSLAVWESEVGSEIRTHRAMFAPGHPLFAGSESYPFTGSENEKDILSRGGSGCSSPKKTGRIEILYDTETGVWEDPNFSFWTLLHLENCLLEAGGLILHCCYLMYRGEAILFTAPSGTGKTTQGKLWERVFGAEIINGDKALLEQYGGRWNAWGYPFHGSAPECRNERYPIRAVVVVAQAACDRVQPLNPAQAFILLFEGITVNAWNKERTGRAADLLQDLAAQVPVVRLECTMRESAAKVLHRYLYGE